MAEVRTVGLVGTGLIGASWAALFLGHGLRVQAFDSRPDFAERLHDGIGRAAPTLSTFGLDAGRGELVICSSLAEACAGTGFVQESVREILELKQGVVAEIDEAAPAEAIIASSSSGFLPSDIQARAKRPQRIVVGHPFNPPYLIPLVEVVGGRATTQDAIDRAAAFYESVGKVAIRLKKEIRGYVANRLQAAIFREVIKLVEADVASVADIDRAVAHGPGLRWAVQGPVLTFQQARDAGMNAFIDEFMDELNAWVSAPPVELAPETRARLVAGATELAAGRSQKELGALRDRSVLGFLKAKREAGAG